MSYRPASKETQGTVVTGNEIIILIPVVLGFYLR
jgi:hypothetical protein